MFPNQRKELGDLTTSMVGLGDLGVTCSPREPMFSDPNPADGFSGRESPGHKFSGRDFMLWVPTLKIFMFKPGKIGKFALVAYW